MRRGIVVEKEKGIKREANIIMEKILDKIRGKIIL